VDGAVAFFGSQALGEAEESSPEYRCLMKKLPSIAAHDCLLVLPNRFAQKS
jgi:hypothetical protein